MTLIQFLHRFFVLVPLMPFVPSFSLFFPLFISAVLYPPTYRSIPVKRTAVLQECNQFSNDTGTITYPPMRKLYKQRLTLKAPQPCGSKTIVKTSALKLLRFSALSRTENYRLLTS